MPINSFYHYISVVINYGTRMSLNVANRPINFSRVIAQHFVDQLTVKRVDLLPVEQKTCYLHLTLH